MSVVNILRVFGAFVFAAQTVVNLSFAVEKAVWKNQPSMAVVGVLCAAASATVAAVLFGVQLP